MPAMGKIQGKTGGGPGTNQHGIIGASRGCHSTSKATHRGSTRSDARKLAVSPDEHPAALLGDAPDWAVDWLSKRRSTILSTEMSVAELTSAGDSRSFAASFSRGLTSTACERK